MPLTYSFLRLGVGPSVACSAAFLLPATLQVALALAVLAFAQDFPVEVNKVSRPDKKHRNSDVWKVLGGGLENYRGWILRVTYGRVQLRCGANDGEHPSRVLLRAVRAGNGGGGDGGVLLRGVNVESRPGSGMVLDAIGRRFGMRGRLWSLWAVQSVGGQLGVILGRVALQQNLIVATLFLTRVGSIENFYRLKASAKGCRCRCFRKHRHRFFFFFDATL